MAATTGLSALTTAFNTFQTDLLTFVVPSATLSAVYGGLIHAHVFHTPQAAQQGKEILKYSVLAMVIAGVGPAILKGVAGMLGLP
jgi:hypothetical protein